MMRQISAVLKSNYQRCFSQGLDCWNACIQSQGNFKGDRTNCKTTFSPLKIVSLNFVNSPCLYDEKSVYGRICL